MLVAASALAKIPPIQVVKRNMIPFTLALLVMLVFKMLGL
jgi:C4-dicarboxylate transporter